MRGTLNKDDFLRVKMESENYKKQAELFDNAIDHASKLMNKKLNSSRSGGLHVSAIGYCPRQIFLDVSGFKHECVEPMSPELLRIFQTGHKCHEKFDEYFKLLAQDGVLKINGIETKVPKNEHDIRGSTDALIEWNGMKIVVDFKSISEKSFKYLNERENSCKFDHYCQANLYAHFFGYDYVMIIYETKERQQVKSFFYKYDSNIAKQSIDKFKMLKDSLNNKGLPKKFSKDSFSCKYCRYRECCHLMSDEDVLKKCDNIEVWNQ